MASITFSMTTFASLVKPEHKVEISGHDTSKIVSVIGVSHELPEETMVKFHWKSPGI